MQETKECDSPGQTSDNGADENCIAITFGNFNYDLCYNLHSHDIHPCLTCCAKNDFTNYLLMYYQQNLRNLLYASKYK